MRLLLAKIGLLDKDDQYMEIKVLQGSREIEQIKANIAGQKEKALSWLLANIAAPIPNNKNLLYILSPMSPLSTLANNNLTRTSLKRDNQEFITLSQNPIFHVRTKYIEI